jgi:hypothetical protein
MAPITPVFSAFTTGDNTVFFTNSKHHIQYPSPLNGAWNERALFAGVTALEISSAREKPSNNNITTAICTRTGTEVGNTNKKAGRQLSWYLFLCLLLVRKSQSTKEATAVLLLEPVMTEQVRYRRSKAMERHIGLIMSIHESEDNWRNVVKGRDAYNFCSKEGIIKIRQ